MTEELNIENPCNYSLEAVAEAIPSYPLFKEVQVKLEKHVEEVECRISELAEKLEKINAVKDGEIGKASTLAGITRAVTSGFNSATSEQVKAELDAVISFKQTGAIPFIKEFEKYGDSVAAEARTYFNKQKFKEYSSLATLEKTNEIIGKLNSYISSTDQHYSCTVRKCGFESVHTLAPNGERVTVSLYNSKISRLKLQIEDN